MFALAGFATFFSSLAIAQPAVLTFSLTVPLQTFDASQLDLRDAQNRPVKSPMLQRRMEELAVKSLHSLFLRNLSPVRRRLLALMNKNWDVASGFFRRAARGVQRIIAFFKSERKNEMAPKTRSAFVLIQRAKRDFSLRSERIPSLKLDQLSSTTLLL